MNDSKFNMWRACVATILIDGRINPEEDLWLKDHLENLPFSEDQKKRIENDIEDGVKFSDVVSKITDKKDRAFLVHQIRVISHLDHDFSDEEKQLLKTFEKHVLSGLNLPEIEAQIAQMEKDSYHEDEVYKTDNPSSVFESTTKAFLKFVNKGDYKLP